MPAHYIKEDEFGKVVWGEEYFKKTKTGMRRTTVSFQSWEKQGLLFVGVVVGRGADKEGAVTKYTIKFTDKGLSKDVTMEEVPAWKKMKTFINRLGREGWCGTRHEASTNIVRKPMKPKDLRPDSIEDIPVPCFIQPKLNGVCALVNKGSGKLMTFGGKEHKVFPDKDHALTTDFDYLACELFIFGRPLPQINSAVHGEHYQDELELWVYDVPDENKTFLERIESLKAVSKILNVVPTYYCRDHKDILEAYNQFIEGGMEGAVTHSPEALYAWDNGTTRKLEDSTKIKPVYDAEFACIGAIFPNPDTFEVILICRPNEGDEESFKVTPGWTEKEKEVFISCYSSPVRVGPVRMDFAKSQPITVEYRDILPSGLPQFAVAKSFRKEGE